MTLIAAVLSSAEPQVDLTVSPAQVAVGESVTLTLTYRWPHGWSIASEPDPGPALRELFVTSAPPPERSSTGEEERRVFRYTVAAARSGAWLLPRPTFSATPPAVGPVVAVEARAPEVIVQVGTEAAPPKLPPARALLVRPPPSLARDHRWWWIGGIGAGLLGLGLWWWGQRQRRRAAAVLSAWQVFEGDLTTVRGASDGKVLGAGLSLALRRYAGVVWNFDGSGQTTREVGATLRRLSSAQIGDDESRDLLRLLGRLDDLRWNAGELPAEAMQDHLASASSWAGGVQRRLDAEAAAKAAGKPR